MENTQITKIDDNTIEVIKTENKEIKTQHTVEYLKQQKIAIQAQKDKDNTQRDLELAEIDELLAECERLNIIEKEVMIENGN